MLKRDCVCLWVEMRREGGEKDGSIEMSADLCLPSFVYVEFEGWCWALTIQQGMPWMDTPVLMVLPELESRERIRGIEVLIRGAIMESTMKFGSTMGYKKRSENRKKKTCISSSANNALLSGFEFFLTDF